MSEEKACSEAFLRYGAACAKDDREEICRYYREERACRRENKKVIAGILTVQFFVLACFVIPFFMEG